MTNQILYEKVKNSILKYFITKAYPSEVITLFNFEYDNLIKYSIVLNKSFLREQ